MTEQKAFDDYDSPWKDILESCFQEFMTFFFSDAAGDIDWGIGHEFWDKELQQVVRDADKLVKVWLKNGQETYVLVHVEIQGQTDIGFSERMFVYNYRFYDRFRKPIVSLAVLADESRDWRPERFSYGLWGSETGITFPAVKMIDYLNRLDMLEASDNPFALATLAHLETQRTRQNAIMRFESKLRFVRSLYDRGWTREKIIGLFHFIDWIMRLPDNLEDRLWVEIHKIEEEGKMQYISSVERIGYKRGLDEGKAEGLTQGLTQGITQGLTQGITQGRIEAIALGLSLKFGDDAALLLMPSIRNLHDTDRLIMIKDAIRAAVSIDEIRQLVLGKQGQA
ncbi:MAG: cytosolic protein [Deltaproteobacteria bacterium]|nr:cytosolic protein [Deltaproteobacteria bacterium]